MNKTNTLVLVMAVEKSPKEAAEFLRYAAEMIEKNGTIEHCTTMGHGRIIARHSHDDWSGEVPLVGRYFGVGYDGEGIDPPRALFAREHDAKAFSDGGTYEHEDDKPSKNGVLFRCDVMMSAWNSFDDDPIDSGMSAVT